MTTVHPANTRPLDLEPTPELHALMAAMDAWIKTGDRTWKEAEDALAAMLRAITYGDSSCTCPRPVPREVNYPFRVAAGGRRDWWIATYQCDGCGVIYTSGWADVRRLMEAGL